MGGGVVVERLGKARRRAPCVYPAAVRGRVSGRYLNHGGAGRRQSKSLGRDHWARARAPSPRPSTPHSGNPPDRAAAARGHFCHTPSVRRWSGASAERGGPLVVRPAIPASRKHESLMIGIGCGCAAQERRWKAPKQGSTRTSGFSPQGRCGRVNCTDP